MKATEEQNRFIKMLAWILKNWRNSRRNKPKSKITKNWSIMCHQVIYNSRNHILKQISLSKRTQPFHGNNLPITSQRMIHL